MDRIAGESRRPASALLPAVSFLACAIFGQAALAQQQVGGMGRIDRSVAGGVDRGIRADAASSRAASFGGRGSAGSRWGTASSATPGREGWGTPSRGESGGMASWSPAGRKPQPADSRLSRLDKPAKPQAGTAGKALSPPLPPIASGAQSGGTPFAFTGKAQHSFGRRNGEGKSTPVMMSNQLRERDPLARLSKQRQLTTRIGVKKQPGIKEQLGRKSSSGR